MNKLIQQLSKKWQDAATKIAETFCKNNGITDEQKFYAKYFQEYKEQAQEVKPTIDLFKALIDSEEWRFYEELIKEAIPEEFENASFTEKQAFLGYRKQIIEDILRIPHSFIEYYEGIQKE
jgi:Tfp pilus assembly protein PilF